MCKEAEWKFRLNIVCKEAEWKVDKSLEFEVVSTQWFILYLHLLGPVYTLEGGGGS